LYSGEELDVPKGLIDNINPAKKLKKLKNFVKELESFNDNTSFQELSDFMNSFKKFTEKEIGRKISLDDLSFEVNKQMNASNIPINPAIVKACFAKLLKHGKHKSLTPHGGGKKQEEQEFSGNPQIILGCVFLASATLIAAIGFAVPPLAPFCTATAQTVGGVGLSFIGAGLLHDEINRKSLIARRIVPSSKWHFIKCNVS
jgi:hypothetical protein